MLKGEAKKTYQREYMGARRRRLKLARALLDPPTSRPVRPHTDPAMPGVTLYREIDADGNVIYEEC